MLSVLTLNVWHGRLWRSRWRLERLEPFGQRRRRWHALLAGLRELAPDVLLLQECLPAERWARSLARALGYDVEIQICNGGLRLGPVGVPLGLEGGDGLAILARPELGLRRVGSARLAGLGWPGARVSLQAGRLTWALACELGGLDRPLRVVTTHLRYTFPDRERFLAVWQALALRGEVQGPPSPRLLAAVEREMVARDAEALALTRFVLRLGRQRPVFLGGDLNLEPQALQVQGFCRAAGLTPLALPGVTWDPAQNPHAARSASAAHADGEKKGVWAQLTALYDAHPQTPDQVFLSPRGWRAEGIERVFDSPYEGVLASDHFGLLTRLAPVSG